MFAGAQESPLQRDGRPHRRGDRELRQEGSADAERDAGRQGVLLRVGAGHAGPGGVQPGGPAGHGGQGARLPPARLPGGRLQEPGGARQQDEGPVLGRPLGQRHRGGDGPEPSHPQGKIIIQCKLQLSIKYFPLYLGIMSISS